MRTIFATTAGLPPTDTIIRTESGREVRSGDIVTADDPIVLAPCDGTGATIAIGFTAIEQERLATWDRVLP